MDIYDTEYFHMNKRFIRFLGLWPYDPKRRIVQTYWIVSLLIIVVPHVTAAIVDYPNMEDVMEDCFSVIVVTQVLLKYCTLAYAENEMDIVYRDIADNWLKIIDEEEKKILLNHSRKGRIFSICYIILLALTVGGFFALPLIPEILNVVFPLAEPRPHLYILKGEFLIENRDDHFYKIYVFDSYSVCSVIVIFMGVDSMYNVTVEQGLALYSILSYRVLKLQGRTSNDPQLQNDSTEEWLIHSIRLHQKLTDFTDNIASLYSTCFFCLSLINIVLLPLTCVVLMVHLGDLMYIVRYSLALFSLLIHVFVLFWPGQKLIDYSTQLFVDSYCNDWYETSPKTKKILLFLMFRLSRPCIMTAGGLVETNFEVYAQIVKTAASYVTVLASYR